MEFFFYLGFLCKKHPFDFIVLLNLCSFSTDVFEKALNAGFIQATDYVEIWQAFLDYLRRRVDFSKGWITSSKNNLFWAHFLLRVLHFSFSRIQ